MKTKSKIIDIQFPTHSNGVVGCTVLLEVTPELKSQDCGGIGLTIHNHAVDHKYLPYAPENEVDIEFDSKGEISKYEIHNPEKLYVALPTNCSTCGKPLKEITDSDFGIIGDLVCYNYIECTAQSASAVYRLAKIAVKLDWEAADLNDEDVILFADHFPEGQITHLSDLKVLLKDDPNTAPRESAWAHTPAKRGWEVEKRMWEFLKVYNLIHAKDFWYIGFNLQDVNYDPRVVLHNHNKPEYQAIIKNNIIRVQQLIQFFDYFNPKFYAV